VAAFHSCNSRKCYNEGFSAGKWSQRELNPAFVTTRVPPPLPIRSEIRLRRIPLHKRLGWWSAPAQSDDRHSRNIVNKHPPEIRVFAILHSGLADPAGEEHLLPICGEDGFGETALGVEGIDQRAGGFIEEAGVPFSLG
jgi:hypothetical protein